MGTLRFDQLFLYRCGRFDQFIDVWPSGRFDFGPFAAKYPRKHMISHILFLNPPPITDLTYWICVNTLSAVERDVSGVVN